MRSIPKFVAQGAPECTQDCYGLAAVHIHFKTRTPAGSALADNAAETYEFTSQLFFDEALNNRVFRQAAYAGKGTRDVRNANDDIFRQAGDTLLLAVADADRGYRTTFDIALDLSNAETGKADRSGRPGDRRGPLPPRG